MGFLDRLRGRDDEPARPDEGAAATGGAGDAEALDGIYAVDEVGTRRLTADEDAALDAIRAGYAEHGIDPADLDSVAAAYDRALELHGHEDSSAVVELLGTAVGDHLVAVGATGGWSAPTRSAPTWPSSRHAAACRW